MRINYRFVTWRILSGEANIREYICFDFCIPRRDGSHVGKLGHQDYTTRDDDGEDEHRFAISETRSNKDFHLSII